MTNAAHVILLNVAQIREPADCPLTASKDITPGMILEFAGTTVLTIQPHSNASAIPSPKLVADVAPWRLGQGIDDDYDEDGELVQVHHLLPGDQFYALLAAGENVDSYADRLGSDGAGALQVATTYAFLRPLELVDNSAGYVSVRIRVEVL
jgi:hypothetical protein